MSKLFVPACGDRITLAKPWQFNLFLERKNIRFAEHQGMVLPSNNGWQVYNPGTYKLASVVMTIDPGTVLECSRVYIRTTNKSAATVEDSYDSITWQIVKNGKATQKDRFWAKLSDCYSLEYDPMSVSRYMDRK